MKAIHNVNEDEIEVSKVVTYHKNKKNLKAIHNSKDVFIQKVHVVTYHKINKFESNSQLTFSFPENLSNNNPLSFSEPQQ
ncbi:MAG: hypothetical protein J6581_02800 [Apibacter sp.]|nr:hypothetical protein [Apibacter sp.]